MKVETTKQVKIFCHKSYTIFDKDQQAFESLETQLRIENEAKNHFTSDNAKILGLFNEKLELNVVQNLFSSAIVWLSDSLFWKPKAKYLATGRKTHFGGERKRHTSLKSHRLCGSLVCDISERDSVKVKQSCTLNAIRWFWRSCWQRCDVIWYSFCHQIIYMTTISRLHFKKLSYTLRRRWNKRFEKVSNRPSKRLDLDQYARISHRTIFWFRSWRIFEFRSCNPRALIEEWTSLKLMNGVFTKHLPPSSVFALKFAAAFLQVDHNQNWSCSMKLWMFQITHFPRRR